MQNAGGAVAACTGKSTATSMPISALIVLLVICMCIIIRWLSPHKIKQLMENQGIGGPNPHFLIGNLLEMKKIVQKSAKLESTDITHDIEHRLFPHFVQWRRTYGKKFVYWVGTEAVLYIQEPKVITEMCSSGDCLNWGRPPFLKNDRAPLFGNGLIMAEGQHWIHQRRVISRGLAPDKLRAMIESVIGSAVPIMSSWDKNIREGRVEIEVDAYLGKITSDIICRALFGSGGREKGAQLLALLKTLQHRLFKSNRPLGVPGSRFIPNSGSREACRLGKEADKLIMDIIRARRADSDCRKGFRGEEDLLGLLLSELEDTQDVVDQCKTLLIAGQETTKLSLTWTLMLLALNPPWQDRVRAEVMEATRGGADPLDIDMLAKMKTMTMVVKEAMRLYPPVAYTVRQAKQEMRVGGLLIPKGMSVVINIVGLHHDPHIWGDDVYEFHPQRFSACNADQSGRRSGGFIPFGFGGRICAGERLANIEQKVVLSMILSTFAFSISPNYVHSPSMFLSIMPSHGMRLLFRRL